MNEELSLICAITGPRGAGKTLLLTHYGELFCMRALTVKSMREYTGNSNLYPKSKTKVYSNYPFHGKALIPGFSGPVDIEPEPFELDKLITWQDEFRDCYILYDEIDQDVDRQDWSSHVAKYLLRGIKLMRHRNISFFCTLQFIDELNYRLYKQADVIIECRDTAHTRWGKESGVELGEEISTSFIDKTGINTGYTYEETHRSYPLLFNGKSYWYDYKTTHEFSVVRPEIKIEREQRIIMPQEQAAEQEADRQRFYNAVSYVIYNNAVDDRVVSSMNFKNTLVEFGCLWHDSQISRELARLGVLRFEKKGIKGWDFRNVDIDKSVPA